MRFTGKRRHGNDNHGKTIISYNDSITYVTGLILNTSYYATFNYYYVLPNQPKAERRTSDIVQTRIGYGNNNNNINNDIKAIGIMVIN